MGLHELSGRGSTFSPKLCLEAPVKCEQQVVGLCWLRAIGPSQRHMRKRVLTRRFDGCVGKTVHVGDRVLLRKQHKEKFQGAGTLVNGVEVRLHLASSVLWGTVLEP